MSDKKRDTPRRKGGRRTGMTNDDVKRETETMLRMRRAGASYASIAETFDLNVKTVYTKISEEMKKLPDEDAKFLRQLEVQKLDHLEYKLQQAINSGDVKAISQARQISESRRKLLGLDMPEAYHMRITREEDDLADQLADLLAKNQRL